jgi:hypothetical protein
LLPSRGAGDQRERDGQNDDMAKNTAHRMMLAGSARSRQRIWSASDGFQLTLRTDRSKP